MWRKGNLLLVVSILFFLSYTGYMLYDIGYTRGKIDGMKWATDYIQKKVEERNKNVDI